MESRKQKEIQYYDQKARQQKAFLGGKGDFEGFAPANLNSFAFCYSWLKKNVLGKIVLDYGCGNGIHSLEIAKMKPGKLIGIDLSQDSLDLAEERLEKQGLGAEFLKMDCEKMEFPDRYFDVIFDGGTFSSLNLDAALRELSRTLKPEGAVLGIETFGHNPLANLKRKINKMTGRRTEWAAEHIIREKDLEEAGKYFNKIETRYFHLFSLFIFPFLELPGSMFFLKIFEFLDSLLLTIPFLRKFAFKVVFIFSEPKNA